MDVDEFHRKWGWGGLQHHDTTCDECAGSGFESDDDDETECSVCVGEGKVFWGSFYWSDIGACEYCKKDDVPIKDMYECIYVCLPCYLSHHAEHCKCELWATPEALVVFK